MRPVAPHSRARLFRSRAHSPHDSLIRPPPICARGRVTCRLSHENSNRGVEEPTARYIELETRTKRS